MYLSGAISFQFPDGHLETLNTGAPMTWLADYLSRAGAPLRPDGTRYSRSQILGGELFDGCPVNVLLNDGAWLPEQLTAINTDPAVRTAVQNCRYFPGGAPTTQLTPNNAPAAGQSTNVLTSTGGATGFPGTVYTPTGVATPTIITIPGGPSYLEPPGPAPEPATVEAGIGLLPMLLLAGAGVFLLAGRKKRGA